MVLPIGPSDLNKIELGQIEPCDLGVKKFAGTLQSFPDAPPSQAYTPILFPPKKISVGEFSRIVDDAINRLRDMEYYGSIVDELITKRFYGAQAASAFSALACSCDIYTSVYKGQLDDPNYALYVQGLNDLFPAGNPVGSINDSVVTYEAGVDDENLQIQQINQAISDFIALNPPFQAVDPQSVIDLNAAIATYNSYVSTRNTEIQAYNTAATNYNNAVGVPNPGTGEYPPNTVNRAIQDFNATFFGQGVLSLIPYLPNVETRDELVGGLPQADPSFTLTFDLNQYLTITITLPISIYTAFQYLQQESQLITVNAPTFGGTVPANDAILYYNNNYVDKTQITPSEQEAVDTLNDAIIAFNSVQINGEPNPDFGDTALLLDAINVYNNLVSNSPDFNQIITSFNSEVIDNINDVQNGASPLFDQAVAIVNNQLPPALQYPAPPNLPQRSLMPTAPSTTTLVVGEVSLLTSPNLYPEFVYNSIEFQTQPPFNPFINNDGTVSVDPVTGDPLIQMPTAEGIPPQPTGGDFSAINNIFAQMNLDIDAYNLNVGDPNAPPVGAPPFSTENEAILYLNSKIEAYNTTPTALTLSDLEGAIADYTSYKTTTSDPNIDSFNGLVDAFNTGSGINTLEALNAEITQLNNARDVYGLPPIPLYTELPIRNYMPSAPVLQGMPPTIAENPTPIFIRSTQSEYTTIPLISQTAIDSIFILQHADSIGCTAEELYAQTAATISDPNFQAYVESLTNSGSLSYVDLSSFNGSISDYLTNITAPPAAGKTVADYPTLSVSGGAIKVDAQTQQQINEEFSSKMALGIISQADIDNYNNYANLVNTTALVTINNIIAAFNATVGNTGVPGVYTANTLNWYGQQVNDDHGTGPVIGPLNIIDEISPISPMPEPLPNIGDVNVVINSQTVDFYSAISQLNSDIQTQPIGPITVGQLNTAIASYNTQVPTENNTINGMNNSISNTFPGDVANLDYFTAVGNLQSYENSIYNPDVLAIESGTGGNYGINTLNSEVSTFNNNSLDNLNTFSTQSISNINAAASSLPFSIGTFDTLDSFATLLMRESMPIAPDSNSGLIPGQISLLPSGRSTYPVLQYSLALTNRLIGIPEEIPEFFSFTLTNSDLDNLNTNVLQPLINKIQDYNGATNATTGLAYENNAVSDMNAAIEAFNAGSITSSQLKDAITDYVRKISTDLPSVNSNIDTLNNITDGIQKWVAALNDANARLEYWGMSPIPENFQIDLRNPMEAPPLPDNGFAQPFSPPLNLLGSVDGQGFPSSLEAIVQNGQSIPTEVPLQLTTTEYFNRKIADAVVTRIARFAASLEVVAKLLERIEQFVQFRAGLRSKRIEFPNSYIQPQPILENPIGEAPRVALAAMAIGFSSEDFERLLSIPIFSSIMSILGLEAVKGLTPALSVYGQEAIAKAGLFASFRTALNLSGRIPPPALTDFRQPVATPVAAIFALNFTREVKNIVASGVGVDLVRQAVGVTLSDDVTRALAAVFNVSLLGVSLVLLGKVFGPGTIPGILRLQPSIRPSGPQNDLPLPTFDDALRRHLGTVKEKLVAGIEQLVGGGIISVGGQDIGKLVQEGIINQLTSVFNTPQQFIDTLNFLIEKATGYGQIRSLRFLALESAAYVADQLPFAIVDQQILNRRVDQEQIGNALSSVVAGNPAEIAAIQTSIQDRALQQSIIEKDALDYRLREDRIRRDLINSDAISQAQIDRDNTLGDIRDALRENSIIEQQRIEAETRDAFDIAERTVNALIQQSLIQRAAIDQRQLANELERRGIVADDVNLRLLEFQRRFDDLQRQGVEGRAAISGALQSVFASIGYQAADAIAATINLSLIGSKAFLTADTASDAEFRERFLGVVHHRLLTVYKEDILKLEDIIRLDILESHNSFVRIMDEELKKLVELQNKKQDLKLADLQKELFKHVDDLGNFVVDRLLVPAYSLIYSTDSGPMYSKAHDNDYRRSIDVRI